MNTTLQVSELNELPTVDAYCTVVYTAGRKFESTTLFLLLDTN